MKATLRRLSGSLAFKDTVEFFVDNLKAVGCRVAGEQGDHVTVYDEENNVVFKALNKGGPRWKGDSTWICIFTDSDLINWKREELFKKTEERREWFPCPEGY